MQQVTYTKLGEHRGSKRLWLEGRRLKDAGFTPGMKLVIEEDEDDCSLIIREGDGNNTVSKRKRYGDELPIIDIRGRRLEQLFGDSINGVHVMIMDCVIIVRVHPRDEARHKRLRLLKDALQDNGPLKLGSVATGLGVLDHAMTQGLKDAGIATEHAFFIEKELPYLEANLRNNPVSQGAQAILGGMEDVQRLDLPEHVDGLIAGLPCTGASLSGRAKNGLKFAEQHETAGALFFAFLRIVEWLNPAFIVLENVVPYSNTVSMHVIRDVLTGWGYELHEATLSGREMGALEDRERLCVVAVTQGMAFDWKALAPVREREAELGEVLEPVAADADNWKEYGYLIEKQEKDIAAGKGFRMQIVGPEVDRVGVIAKGYAKVRSTEPKVKHPTDEKLMRQLTPVEHARCMTIPEDLIDALPNTTAHEVLGQSVTHAAFVAVGRCLGAALKTTH